MQDSSINEKMGTDSQLVPLYLQIKRSILRKIYSGEWPVHHNIPSEKALTELFKVSRMTVNRALRELTAQGVLVRVQGVGTFVSENKGESALMSVRNIADEIKSHNHVHRTDVILLEKCIATPELALVFEMMAGQVVFHSIMVHYDNNIPVQLEDRYVNSLVAPEYLKQDFSVQTPNEYLTAVAPLTEGEHIVESILVGEKEAAWLQIDQTEPCLQIRRKTWSNQNVVTSAQLIYTGARYRLEGHFHS